MDAIKVYNGTGPKPFIAVCVPTLGMVHIYFATRLLHLRAMNRALRHYVVAGKEVGLARNELVANALLADEGTEARCTHVLFLDDDVLFHPEVLGQLLSRQRPIVSGLYYAKTVVPTPLVLHGEFQGVEQSWTPGDLVECEGHGMGLTLIEADVFRRLRDETELGVDSTGLPNWFTTTHDAPILRADGGRAVYSQTEDMAFLGRAKALGYKPSVDTSLAAFGWHYDVQRETGYPAKQWLEFMTKHTMTWDTPNGPVTWEMR